MKKYQKIIGVILAVVFLASGCNKTEQVRDPGTNDANLEQTNQQSAGQIVSSTPKTQSSVKEKPVENIIKYNGREGKNALELLKSTYTVETKSYGSAGEFVESINGIKPDANHFWEFFVNGKSASVGAGSYITKSDDVLEWKLNTIQ